MDGEIRDIVSYIRITSPGLELGICG